MIKSAKLSAAPALDNKTDAPALIHLRPHHLMCIQNYRGHGYSEAFQQRMVKEGNPSTAALTRTLASVPPVRTVWRENANLTSRLFLMVWYRSAWVWRPAVC